ncbi:cysteine-rich receptor-like protein kinase 26 [Panicum miliaceum]|uniref:Cysteine-rich receptor-like protein kinase 26 n=1 Tax=Panicum miliaceum TaxID=4540 RepID=A0A3L6QV57_PANMI|nr:cysteine-rich receptor-like protein kinase 26 [Panicum miliaceum]
MNAAFCCAQVADGVDKIGPCGGGGGEHCDVTKIPHCLESITVRNGLIVDSIQFSYRDREGTLHTSDRWGGPGGFEHVTIKLGSGTSLKRMSGTYAPFSDETVIITSLTFVTSDNIKYGPSFRSWRRDDLRHSSDRG